MRVIAIFRHLRQPPSGGCPDSFRIADHLSGALYPVFRMTKQPLANSFRQSGALTPSSRITPARSADDASPKRLSRSVA